MKYNVDLSFLYNSIARSGYCFIYTIPDASIMGSAPVRKMLCHCSLATSSKTNTKDIYIYDSPFCKNVIETRLSKIHNIKFNKLLDELCFTFNCSINDSVYSGYKIIMKPQKLNSIEVPKELK